MTKISSITKRDIYDLFKYGMSKLIIFDVEKILYPYHGRLNEIDFINRLYDLKDMVPLNNEYENSEEEIIQHTIRNDDYSYCWIFEDDRFELINGDDEIFLNFLCEVFHPEVRNENLYWKEFFEEVNKILMNDQFELYPITKISNREVFGWRVLVSKDNKLFIPFTQRNKKKIKLKVISLSIGMKSRVQIYHLLNTFNDKHYYTDESNWNAIAYTSEEVLRRISLFYKPLYYNDKEKKYIATDDFKEFILHGSPYCIMDTIELFETYMSDNHFEIQINQILELNEINFRINHGEVKSIFNHQLHENIIEYAREVGLNELLQVAINYYDSGDVKMATEKLWDAFERLKTYYYPTLDKKKSVSKLIDIMSDGNQEIKDTLDKEFKYLSTIGNDFRIRHHENGKYDIDNKYHFDYFYRRCLSLISVAVKYLD